jgi:TctA family transporter
MHTHVTGSTMRSGMGARSRVRSGLVAWLAAAALAVLPGVSQAQEATVIGTVTDESGGVMPGVVVTAIHEASGNRFEAVT